MAVADALAQSQQTELIINWEQYLQAPETTEPQEILEGRLVKMPSPTALHQITVGNLYYLLRSQLGEAGIILIAPMDLVIQKEPLRVRQPDLMCCGVDQFSSPLTVREAKRFEIAPRLIVEVVSPHDTFEGLLERLDDYHSLGVPEVWLVGFPPQHLFVLERSEQDWNWYGLYAGEARVVSSVLPNLEITVKQILE